ncbi:MAG: putative transporter [Bacteroidales bacterium]|nr:putative transporter [Bacteroidales bacterium]MBQ9529643.1 putative transporter [Bacteroidales bacterium]
MMNLLTQGGTAGAILVLALVIAIGLWLGRFKAWGISFGTVWILFVGIILGHFGLRIDPTMLAFIKDFGLILFVFAIGLQVGPGFFGSFRKEGLPMNLLAVAMVILTMVTTYVIHLVSGENLAIMTGVMSGAITNTPGLGAAQQALTDATAAMGGSAAEAVETADGIASAYAVAYPIGVLGAMLLVIILKWLFRIDIEKEKALNEKDSSEESGVLRIACKVENPAIFGKRLAAIAEEKMGEHFVVSRVMRSGEVSVPESDWILAEGDKLLIVTDQKHRDMVRIIFGEECTVDMQSWQKPGSKLMSRRLSITQSEITGKSLRKLDIRHKYGVTVTRILRAGIELQAEPDVILQVGDSIQVVGTEEGIKGLSKLIGNKPETLSKPNLVPIFFGIALGVLVGTLPIKFPSMSQPLRLGLAGGALIVAILLGHFGPKLRITTYTALSANLMIREIGLSLFMAAVGVGAGENFVSSLIYGGYIWILYAFLIVTIPMAIAALIAKFVLKMDFLRICGMLAGGTTDVALLSFSEQAFGSGRIAVNYATVYPLTMFLRVVAAQIMIMIYL